MNQDELKEYMNDIKRSLEEHIKDDKGSFKSIDDKLDKVKDSVGNLAIKVAVIVGILIAAEHIFFK